MDARHAPRSRRQSVRAVRAFAVLLVTLTSLAVALAASSGAVPVLSGPSLPVHHLSAQNESTGDPPESATSGGLCPSGGPVILGINWNCVAVLNLTEIALILVSIGIVAYVFKDADRAELPGDSAEVPVTAEEWEAYRRSRELGVAYAPPELKDGDQER